MRIGLRGAMANLTLVAEVGKPVMCQWEVFGVSDTDDVDGTPTNTFRLRPTTLDKAEGLLKGKHFISGLPNRIAPLLGRAFTAEEGAEWGLVNKVCEPGKTLADALETAQAIAANAPLAVRQAKKSVHYGLQMDLLTGYRFEIEAYNRLVDTEDRREGVRAFNEKRKPVFKGR